MVPRCLPDTIGILTQSQALILFASGCYDNMPEKDSEGNAITYIVGLGYWAYVFCVVAAIVRAAMNYVMPVPGGGAGLHCVDMKGALINAHISLASGASAVANAAESAVEAGTEMAWHAAKDVEEGVAALKKGKSMKAAPGSDT